MDFTIACDSYTISSGNEEETLVGVKQAGEWKEVKEIGNLGAVSHSAINR